MRAKSAMAKEDAGKRMQHARALECQGQVFRCREDGAASIWSVAVQKLPPELLKFSLNAVQDTLPHNANLAIWRRREGLSSACKLCGKRQTLLHVLNNCPKALDMRRYNERHDAVLGSHLQVHGQEPTRRTQTPGRPFTVPALCHPPPTSPPRTSGLTS